MRLILLTVFMSFTSLALLTSCATNDSPPVRRVSAEEFMRPHTFKGLATDQFIGITHPSFGFASELEPDRAFKQVYEMGFFHNWAILWCPVDELPEDYLRHAKERPNRIPATLD